MKISRLFAGVMISVMMAGCLRSSALKETQIHSAIYEKQLVKSISRGSCNCPYQFTDTITESNMHKITRPAMPTGSLFEMTDSVVDLSTDDCLCCSQNHQLEYCFAFGRSEFGKLHVFRHYEPVSQANITWVTPGRWEVVVKARCSQDNTIQSEWSKPMPITILDANKHPMPESNNFHVPEQRSATAENVVIIVHGQATTPDNGNIISLQNELTDALKRSVFDENCFDIRVYDWSEHAATEGTPSQYKKIIAGVHGVHLAKWIIMQDRDNIKYRHIHLIGHSLGAKIIDESAYWISRWDKDRVMHTTFLDAFTPSKWADKFGEYSTWSDSYFNKYHWGNSDYWFTDHILPNACNVDVTALKGEDYYNDLRDGHAWPLRWYIQTVKDFPVGRMCDKNYGFALSKMANSTIWNSPPADLPKTGNKTAIKLPHFDKFVNRNAK